MKNDEYYVSLYDYLGKASRESGLGQKVYNAAKEKGIHVIYTDLPEERRQPEYNRVATYPKTFLDKYFGKTETPLSDMTLEERVENLEKQIAELTKKVETNVTNSNEYDDDLPF
jgi:hypothetical protein